MAAIQETIIPDLYSYILPEILSGEHSRKGQIRIWQPECGTGETAYKIASIFQYRLRDRSMQRDLRVFGTDSKSEHIREARKGIIKDLSDLPYEPAAEFFSQSSDGYLVRSDLRACCSFAEHDLFIDAPFSGIDLIVCENLPDSLLVPDAFHILHYAMGQKALLWCNQSIPAEARPFFNAVAENVYRKRISDWGKRIPFPKGRSEFSGTAAKKELPVEESLQITLEELSVAHEELQTAYEELHVTNAELDEGNRRLTAINNDLNNLLGSLGFPVLTVDSRLRIRLFNRSAEQYLGLLERDKGRLVSDMNFKNMLENPTRAIETVIRTRERYQEEVQDEQGRWHQLQIQPFIDGTGRVTGAVIMFIDIHERKLAQQREETARRLAESSNEAKDHFLSILSHELRTPLTPILTWIQLLRTQKLTPETYDSALKGMERNLKTQVQLIDDLLDTSRIAAGKMNLAQNRIPIAEILSDAVETVQPLATAKDVKIELNCARDGIVVGDKMRLQQVFWNILSNAVKFSTPGSRVSVLCERNDERLSVDITDNGPGLSPIEIEYIFDRFKQVDNPMTRRHGGLGLGLSIARSIVEMHGGKISVQSSGHGTGSTFSVRLPVAKSA